MKEIDTAALRQEIPSLRAGERVLLSGTVYTARDEAHAALFRLLDAEEPLPFDLKDAAIYYAGPTPGRNGMPVGSCGPTTSSRMDGFTPRLLGLGLAAMIGKGDRSDAVVEAIRENGAVYFAAVGGAGALMAKHITAAEVIAFPELGCEAVRRLTVEKMPLTVAVDAQGNDLFRAARARWARK